MKKLLIIMTLVLTSISMSAHDNKNHPRFNPQVFKAKLETYITQKAGLTNAESEKFFPIYHEMKHKQRELSLKAANLKRQMSCKQDATDKNYNETISAITELNVKSAEIEQTYYKKLCKTISPQKVYRAMMADDAFHREMLQGFYKKKK